MENITDLMRRTLQEKMKIYPSDNRCETCRRFLLIEEGREFCFHCETIAAEDKKIAQEVAMNYEKMVIKKLLDKFEGQSLINPKLLKSTFENYFPENETQEYAHRICKRYAINFKMDNPVDLILIGSFGVGKSHLAVSITKAIMEKGIPTLFISVPKLLTKLKSTYNKSSEVTEDKILSAIENVPLLVLDDIGAETDEEKEKVNSWAKTKLFEIVDSRIGRHTIFTTNLDTAKLMNTYGERNASRILEDSTRLKIEGENYRLRDL